MRRLTAGRFALLFANAGTGNSDRVAVSGAMLMAFTGWRPAQIVRMRNVWAGADGPSISIGGGFESGVLGAAAVEMHILTPVF